MSHRYRSCLQVMSTGRGKGGGGPQLLSFLSGICGGERGDDRESVNDGN